MLIKTCEMHTGGEPLRIIESGFPDVEGGTILEKRAFVKENYDNIRKLLMHEPRGHSDMYGAIIVKPDHPEAHFGVLFTHSEGYSTMCGHAVIALARYAVEKKIVEKSSGEETEVRIQCPCGLVKSWLNNQSGCVRFESVTAFTSHKDVSVDVDGIGSVSFDISFGGTFYAILPAKRLGLDVSKDSLNKIIDAATELSDIIKEKLPVNHPKHPELSFLYGVILTDGNDKFDASTPTKNITIFADRQVDRSPTGSGVTARIAAQFSKQHISLQQTRVFECPITGTQFKAKAVRVEKCGDIDGVAVEVSGKAHFSGSSSFILEEDDPLQTGFITR